MGRLQVVGIDHLEDVMVCQGQVVLWTLVKQVVKKRSKTLKLNIVNNLCLNYDQYLKHVVTVFFSKVSGCDGCAVSVTGF